MAAGYRLRKWPKGIKPRPRRTVRCIGIPNLHRVLRNGLREAPAVTRRGNQPPPDPKDLEREARRKAIQNKKAQDRAAAVRRRRTEAMAQTRLAPRQEMRSDDIEHVEEQQHDNTGRNQHGENDTSDVDSRRMPEGATAGSRRDDGEQDEMEDEEDADGGDEQLNGEGRCFEGNVDVK